MTESTRLTLEETRRLGEQVGIDWSNSPFGVERIQDGIEVEFEHGSHDPATDVTHDDPVLTGKIALAHLKEFPDYYVRLERMEREAKEQQGSR